MRPVNVVLSLTRLGSWRGRPILLSLPERAEPRDRIVILVQARSDRHIMTAATR